MKIVMWPFNTELVRNNKETLSTAFSCSPSTEQSKTCLRECIFQTSGKSRPSWSQVAITNLSGYIKSSTCSIWAMICRLKYSMLSSEAPNWWTNSVRNATMECRMKTKRGAFHVEEISTRAESAMNWIHACRVLTICSVRQGALAWTPARNEYPVNKRTMNTTCRNAKTINVINTIYGDCLRSAIVSTPSRLSSQKRARTTVAEAASADITETPRATSASPVKRAITRASTTPWCLTTPKLQSVCLVEVATTHQKWRTWLILRHSQIFCKRRAQLKIMLAIPWSATSTKDGTPVTSLDSIPILKLTAFHKVWNSLWRRSCSLPIHSVAECKFHIRCMDSKILKNLGS